MCKKNIKLPYLAITSVRRRGALCHGPPSDPKNTKCINSIRQWRNYVGQGPQFKINDFVFWSLVYTLRKFFMTTVRFLCLIFILRFHPFTDKISSHMAVK